MRPKFETHGKSGKYGKSGRVTEPSNRKSTPFGAVVNLADRGGTGKGSGKELVARNATKRKWKEIKAANKEKRKAKADEKHGSKKSKKSKKSKTKD